MQQILGKLGNTCADKVVKALELAKKENETGVYGIEKEFGFTSSNSLYPLQRIGKHSAYHFVMTYGNIPEWAKKKITPEIFDYMIEIGTDPCYSVADAVKEAFLIEAELWKAVNHIRHEFPNMEEIFLNKGNLFKPASIKRENIPNIWGEDKKSYFIEVINSYGDSLTPQGQHDNISVPEPLIAYQYHKVRNKYSTSSIAYIEFKNELYVWLASQLRAFASLIIAISANTPFDYTRENGKDFTILTGNQSSRWLKLPQIKSSVCPLMLKDYEHFQKYSKQLINEQVIIGSNNYMPVRPKGELRLGEVPLSLERAAWFHDIVIDDNTINTNPVFSKLKGKKNVPFLNRLEVAERSGWLKEKGYTLKDLLWKWRKDNVRRLLGVPLNRLEVRCCEIGGTIEYELAKSSFIQTLVLYIFSNPGFGAKFIYSDDDLKRVVYNEFEAAKKGMDADIFHPYSYKKMTVREFLKWTLVKIEDFSKELGTYEYLLPVIELSKGEKNQAERAIKFTLNKLGKDIKKTKNDRIIVPDEILKEILELKKQYVHNVSCKLRAGDITKISPEDIFNLNSSDKLSKILNYDQNGKQ